MEVSLNVVIGESRNINSSRGGGSFSVFTKVEFQAEILGESSRHELQEGISHVNMDFSASRVCKMDTNAAAENIMRNPLIVSVFEVLPKDKKAKEEKTQLLGIGSLDLLPFFKGEQTIENSLILYPLNYQPNETNPPSLIELNIKVSTEKLLLSEQEKDHGNILFLRVKGLYSLPDALAAGGAHTYTVCTPSPSHLVNPIDVLAAQGGEVRNSGNADIALANKKWKWPTVNPSSVGMASLISNSSLTPNAVEDEKGHLKCPNDVEFRRSVECTKPNVSWNTELRVLLSSNATSAFLSSLSSCSVWPVEIVRVLNIIGKGKVKDETTLSYNGICYVDLSTLLYPGATKVFGAYPVGPLIESELGKKCTVTGKSLMENIHKATSTPVKGLAVGKRLGTSTRQSMISMASQTSMNGLDDNTEGHSYSDSQSYMLLEFELAKPLVPKRTAIAIADRIMEYIPPRPALPKRVGGVEKAINDYHTATVDVASLLLADYRSLYGDEVSENTLQNTPESNEDRRKKLIYHLNKSGHYHAYKEHLKKSVLELVRQKFINEASTTNEEELQAFLSKLYTYLIDEMHKGLGETFSLEQSVSDPQNIVDCDMLRQYALESEQMQNMEMAEYYHKELLSREGHISLHWYEYGVYHLLNSDYDKAEQCFKESIALDQKFVPALLLYGICCTVNEKHSMANEVLELATTIDEYNTFAWTIRGLCSELSFNTLIRDMSLEQAYKLTPVGKKKTYIVVEKNCFKKTQEKHPEEIEESELQSQVTSDKTMPLTDQALTEQSEAETPDVNVTSTPVPDSLNNTQELQIQPSTNHERASDQSLKECETSSNADKDDYEFSPFIQTASYLLDVNVAKFAEMCLAHEYVFQSSKRGKTNKRGTSKSEVKTTENAIVVDRSTPTEFISLQYDINMGRLLMLNGDYRTAQTFLERAVQKDILNSNALALHGNCLYLSGEFDLAKDYYQRVVEYVNPPAHLNTILLRLADIYMRHEEYSPAKFTYLRACRHSPSSLTWKGVGIASYMLQEYENSEDALSEANILNNLDPEIWAYLSLLCVKTSRPQEAVQAASFALKNGLTDVDLLEILPKTDP